MAIHHRLPPLFWIVLFVLTVLAMVVGGYDFGVASGRRSITAVLVATLAFSVVLFLVVGLDRPENQLQSISQTELIDLQQNFRRSMKLR